MKQRLEQDSVSFVSGDSEWLLCSQRTQQMLGWNSIRILVRIKETRLIPGLMRMGQVEQNLHYGPEEIRDCYLPDLLFKL